MGHDLRMPAAFVALQRSQIFDSAATEVGTDRTIDVSVEVKPGELDRGSDSQDADTSTETPITEANGDEDDLFFENEPSVPQSRASSINNDSSKYSDGPAPASAPASVPVYEADKVYQIPTGSAPLSSRSFAAQNYYRDQRVPAATKFAASTPALSRSDSQLGHRSAPSQDSQAAMQARLASTASFSSGVDRYGFKNQSNYISNNEFLAWSADYTKYCDRRKEKWRILLREHGLDPGSDVEAPVRFPPESQRLKRYVRKGIPPEWRGNAWFWYARGHEKMNAHPGLYAKLVVDTETLKNGDTEHIERDLHRTFPDNINFRNDPLTNQESELLRALRRVLRSFSIYQPKIGYCQSLNFIAGNLLLFIDEERAFWLLVIVTQNYLAGLHDVNLEQVNISQGILMISVRDRLPKIWTALNLEQSFEDNFISNLPPISLCTAPWFMSVMVNVLPTETMMRVWDCFFLEGPKTLYRIALTIFKLVEPQLCQASDELEVFQIVQAAPRRLYNPEILMKSCFKRSNGFGHISNEDIAMLRAFVQTRRKLALEGSPPITSDRHEYARLHRGRRIKAKLSLYR